ncbi:hypothetical protein [Rhodovibrio salinarum]|uniref:hypothetical protein n=1 Tax=Rhodovibrio salinarum TaxID=1087 RepID=UPI0004BAA696|nr:hypothetical protein [Rhodovibrio salinarum]
MSDPAHWTLDDAGRGDRSAEIADDGTLEIEIHFVDGDEPTLTAQREISSVAC